MKILRNKTYNKLLDYKNKYLEILWQPMQGVFEKVTDDELLVDNGNLYAETEELKELLNEANENAKSWQDKYNTEYNRCQQLTNTIENINDLLLTYGEVLPPKFQKEMLKMLRSDK